MDAALIEKLKVQDKASQEQNRAALFAHREEVGQVAVTCKCGAESVMAKVRPAKAPTPKCGVCGSALQ
jgi:hypothetical protein